MPFPDVPYKVQAYYQFPATHWTLLRETITPGEAEAFAAAYIADPELAKSNSGGLPRRVRVLDKRDNMTCWEQAVQRPNLLQQEVNEVLDLGIDFSIPAHVKALLKASPKLLELCESLSSALDTVLLHHGQAMPPGDQQGRRALVTQAEALLKTLEPERP